MRGRKAVATAAACVLAAMLWACASAPPEEELQPLPIDPALLGKPAVAEVPKPSLKPLPLEAPVPPLFIPRSPRRPPSVEGRLDVPLKRKWLYIVIHHSATESGNEAIFGRYQKHYRGWDGIGYDFVICNGHGGPDGLVQVTYRWERQIQGAHARHPETNIYNEHGIGICLVGDFNRTRPTARQMEALVGLINYLQDRCRIPTRNILMHRQIWPGHTVCPGKNFPFYELLARLEH